jgi:hypothetical protein
MEKNAIKEAAQLAVVVIDEDETCRCRPVVMTHDWQLAGSTSPAPEPVDMLMLQGTATASTGRRGRLLILAVFS